MMHALAAAHAHAGFDFADILLDTAADSLRMLPFLFAAYLVIEYIERKKSHHIESLLARGGRFGFVPGALLGLVPQCGFSAMAANFYASRVISLGTLLSVFLAASDESVPILLAQPGHYRDVLLLLACKFCWALAAGFAVDVLLRRVIPPPWRGGYGGGAEVNCHRHDEGAPLLLAAARHTARIFLAVFLFTLAFGLLVGAAGEGRISALLSGMGVLQPLLASLFGLIPSCASSVLLTQLYTGGAISFGSAVGGLCTNAGIGLTVLFRANRNPRQNIFILALLLCLGGAAGLVLHLLGV